MCLFPFPLSWGGQHLRAATRAERELEKKDMGEGRGTKDLRAQVERRGIQDS